VLCRVHATNSAQAKAAAARLETAFVLSPKRQPPSPLVVELVR